MILGFLVACGGSSKPTEADVFAKIKGSYCDEEHQMILTDSSYYCKKRSMGFISSRRSVIETCEGKYQLTYANDSWIIQFQKAEKVRGIMDCEKQYVLWNKENGYLVGEDNPVMWDLFDGAPLPRGICEE